MITRTIIVLMNLIFGELQLHVLNIGVGKKHIDKISNKISKITSVLKKLKFIMQGYILHTIYNSLIIPPFKLLNSEKNVYVSVLLIPLIFLLVSFFIKNISTFFRCFFVTVLKNIILARMILPAIS